MARAPAPQLQRARPPQRACSARSLYFLAHCYSVCARLCAAGEARSGRIMQECVRGNFPVGARETEKYLADGGGGGLKIAPPPPPRPSQFAR